VCEGEEGLKIGEGVACRQSNRGVGWIVIATDVQKTARDTPQLQHTAPRRAGAESAAVTLKGYLHYRIQPETGKEAREIPPYIKKYRSVKSNNVGFFSSFSGILLFKLHCI